jgi:hypothetical protein
VTALTEDRSVGLTAVAKTVKMEFNMILMAVPDFIIITQFKCKKNTMARKKKLRSVKNNLERILVCPQLWRYPS